MPETDMPDTGPDSRPPGGPRISQTLAGGLVLIALALLALWATRDLDPGSLRSIGPGGLPRAMAILIGLFGAVICLTGWRRGASTVEGVAARPVLVIMLAIVVFAMTIRPWSFGAVSTPGLGLVAAGPLTVLVAGFAQRDRDWLDLGILASALTAFCMLLFGDLLNLPIPVMPIPLLGYFPGWEQREVLRLLAGLLLAIAVILWVIRRRRAGSGAGA